MKKVYRKYFLFLLFFSFLAEISFGQNISVNTTGNPAATTNMFEVLGVGTATNYSAFYVSQSAAVTNAVYGFQLFNTSTNSTTAGLTKYGMNIQSTGTWTGGANGINMGLQVAATGGSSNYAIIVPASSGFVGIGTSAPSTLFHVDGNTASTTQTIATITGNSLTSGKGLLISSSSLL